MRLEIRRLSYSLGAEVVGVDLRNPLDEETFSEIRSAFLEHLVLLFRGPSLTREQHLAFSRRFGELDTDPSLVRNGAQYPEISVNIAQPSSRTDEPKARPIGMDWHSDRSVTLVPAGASLLRALKIPPVGGDTMFANLYLAYETLSEGMQKLIEGLHGVHPGPKRRFDESTPERLAESKRLNPPVAQPLVRVHPETGRKSLYIGEKVRQLAGMTTEESKPLIEFLCQHTTRPQFVYRHQWREHDLIMWDNRCTNHVAVGDFDRTQIRHMERTQVKGARSGYAYDGPLEDAYY